MNIMRLEGINLSETKTEKTKNLMPIKGGEFKKDLPEAVDQWDKHFAESVKMLLNDEKIADLFKAAKEFSPAFAKMSLTTFVTVLTLSCAEDGNNCPGKSTLPIEVRGFSNIEAEWESVQGDLGKLLISGDYGWVPATLNFKLYTTDENRERINEIRPTEGGIVSEKATVEWDAEFYGIYKPKEAANYEFEASADPENKKCNGEVIKESADLTLSSTGEVLGEPWAEFLCDGEVLDGQGYMQSEDGMIRLYSKDSYVEVSGSCDEQSISNLHEGCEVKTADTGNDTQKIYLLECSE